MTKASPAPTALMVRANGLDHRVLEWPSRTPSSSTRTIMLVHGYLDAAGTWDKVAPALAARGHRVLAPDMRGFGDSDRAPQGSYYHFPDYVADLAEMIEALALSEPLALVGHSMGGTIATLYAGAFPERVARLVSLEGLGPPDNAWEEGPLRMRRWIEECRAVRARGEPPPLRREDARRRLLAGHLGIARDVLDHRLPHLVREVHDAEGTNHVAWRYDPRHRTTSPSPFFAALFNAFAKRVRCPVLFVSGGEAGFHVPDEEERLAAFSHLERVTIDDGGHMMHWTRPDVLAALLVDFLRA